MVFASARVPSPRVTKGLPRALSVAEIASLLDGLAYSPMLAQSDGIVEFPLSLVEFDGLHDLDLRRQIPRHCILGAA